LSHLSKLPAGPRLFRHSTLTESARRARPLA
jgi:hypothetical protein